jgi:hypothetical protein
LLPKPLVQGTEEYNQAIIKAVKQWEFLPARDEADVPVESEAYGICVYRLVTPYVIPPQQ